MFFINNPKKFLFTSQANIKFSLFSRQLKPAHRTNTVQYEDGENSGVTVMIEFNWVLGFDSFNESNLIFVKI